MVGFTSLVMDYFILVWASQTKQKHDISALNMTFEYHHKAFYNILASHEYSNINLMNIYSLIRINTDGHN